MSSIIIRVGWRLGGVRSIEVIVALYLVRVRLCTGLRNHGVFAFGRPIKAVSKDYLSYYCNFTKMNFDKNKKVRIRRAAKLINI